MAGRDTRGQLTDIWAARDVDAGALVPDHGGTLSARTVLDVTEPTLPAPPDFGHEPVGSDAVVLGPTLATGGIGVIHLAHQPSLKREVAAKVLRPDRRAPELERALLREAWVTGGLEHPSVVPVHMLTSRDGDPVMVMKRVEGTAWSELIHDPAAPARFGASDPLEWHLRVLIQVCHAVHFAHSRGVLHLDLKPDNVMVGRFGEVYLVDWGIAVSLPDGPGWLPAAADITTVCGTPAYMAPEQASAEGERVGVATDVYGLGAMLHEVVTRRRRHEGADVRATLEAAYASAPFDYDEHVPSELARVLHRSMAWEPAGRFADVDALRRALEGFLSHRSSASLADVASARLAELARRLEAEDDGDTLDTQRTFQECRFGFQQALAIWADNVAAREGLRRLLRLMATHALAHRQRDRAAECLAELDPPDPELAHRLALLDRELNAEARRIEALERDVDPDFLHRHRSKLSTAAGVAWLLWNLTCGGLHRTGTLTFGPRELVVMAGLTLVIYLVVLWFVRGTLLTSAVNRNVFLGLFGSGFFSITALWGMCGLLDTGGPEAVALGSIVYIYFVLALSVIADRRAGWALIVVAPLVFAGALHPELAFELAGAIGLSIGVWLAIIWRRPRTPTRTGSRARARRWRGPRVR